MRAGATLSIGAQVAVLRSRFPFGKTTWNRFALKWAGIISPSNFGRNYEVELAYRIGEWPEVWVRKPNLRELSGGRRLPHTYDQKSQKLCLFRPSRGFWTPDRALAVTLIPWTYFWLYYFELWLVTDEWSGSGEHPEPRNTPLEPAPPLEPAILF